jgi:radical SAM protein with 4Fe4S-binding SPASM domain
MLHLKDSINFISKLNASRILNAFLVLISYYISKILKNPIQLGLPISVSIEPTTSCNLRCPECPSGLRNFTRKTGMMQKDLFEKIISELHKKSLYFTFYFQGEPYLNTHFLDMVKIASSKKIYTATSTNAHFLTPENAEKTVKSGLDRLIISIDGTTQETYQQYRIGGSLEKVIQGTKNIIQAKRKLKSSKPHVIFQFLVVKPNEHQIKDVLKLAKELGVDEVKFKTAQVYDYKYGNPLIPDNPKYSRYQKLLDGTYIIKNKLLNHCWKLWHSCVITWDGKVVPCCFDKDAKYQLGDIQESKFEKIWQSKSYYSFRKAILQSRKEIDICSNCSEGTKVWA